MILGLRANPLQVKFIKEKDIEQELSIRKSMLLKNKDDSIMLLLLIDLLICWANQKV
jgi:hypothetical protein